MLTKLAQVQQQIQQFWSFTFIEELREKLLLGGLVNRDYTGDLKAMGDTVKVSQINAPKGQLKTVGVDADSFESEQLSMSNVEVKADKRAIASFKMQDLVQIQSQLGAKDSSIRQALMFAVEKQINDHLYSFIAPQVSHEITGVTDFNAGQVSNIRKLAGQAKWMKTKPWWLLVDPSYHKDLLDSQTLTSSDFVGDDKPVIGGQIINKRFGLNIVEDDSRPTDFALAFHPDWLLMVLQKAASFEISSLHSQNQLGFVISVDVILGAKLGIAGAAKHIRVRP